MIKQNKSNSNRFSSIKQNISRMKQFHQNQNTRIVYIIIFHWVKMSWILPSTLYISYLTTTLWTILETYLLNQPHRRRPAKGWRGSSTQCTRHVIRPAATLLLTAGLSSKLGVSFKVSPPPPPSSPPLTYNNTGITVITACVLKK